MKFEHLLATADTRDEVRALLKTYSEDGWELVAVTTAQGVKETGAHFLADVPWLQWDVFFKRPANLQA